MYNFDEVPNRKNSNCCKWDGQEGDYLPFWVADMDFLSPRAIVDALEKRITHGVFGYGIPDEDLLTVICKHYKDTYGYELEKDWIVFVPGVMPAVNIACRMTSGDIFINIPIYNNILGLKDNLKRNAIESKLVWIDGVYTFDFQAMEREITPSVTTFVLCNPHNPVGRVYTIKELEGVADFCEKHNLLLVSDEIHSELILEGTHTPAFTICESLHKRCITFSSAAKICNIPGIPFAFGIIPDQALRDQFLKAAAGLFPALSILGMEAMRIAYTDCKEWKADLLTYLRENRDYLETRIHAMSGLSVYHSQGTYLAWINAEELAEHLSEENKTISPWRFFLDNANVHMSNGADYGAKNFLRFNYACPRSQLKEALDRMEFALDNK